MKWWRVLARDAADALWSHGAVAVEHECGHFVHVEEAAQAGAELEAKVLEGAPEWAADWLREHQAIRISGRIAIAPSWVAVEAPLVLRIDPGLAFGTGTHPTTQLCLRELERCVRPGLRVLDVGTGTGVLAICALKLGALSALGTDISEVALRTAARLARRHQVPVELAREAKGRFDLVLANLPVEAQEELAPRVAAHLAPGGTLLVSGFLAEVRVEPLYPGLRVEAREEQAGWGLLRMSDRSDTL